MKTRVENLYQTEKGPRFALTGDFMGAKVTVVTGYAVSHDAWMSHVYVKLPGQPEQRVGDIPAKTGFKSQQDAYEAGFRRGEVFVEAKK